jgi:hypothetical protein
LFLFFYKTNQKSYTQSVEATTTKKKAVAKAQNNAKTKKMKKLPRNRPATMSTTLKRKLTGATATTRKIQKKKTHPQLSWG